ncbi:MAG: tRNA (guanosine(37)-N1)-methyltransferase TrmD, partial [Myxococcota bacterium]
PEFRGQSVPAELLSGNHALIERWRHENAIERTALRRPDLLRRAADEHEELSNKDRHKEHDQDQKK